MAALIFDSVGKLFSGCGFLCNSCGEACEGCCSLLALPFKNCGEFTRQVVCSPFFPYLAVTMLCNLPPILGVVGGSSSLSCHWLTVNAVVCCIHIIASFYISHTIEKEKILVPAVVATTGTGASDGKGSYDAIPATASSEPQRYRDSPMERLKHVLCYDPGVAIYIVVLLFWMVWLAYGFEEAVLGENDADESDTPDDTHGQHECSGPILTAMFAGGTYGTLVICSFGCALACMK